MVEKSLAQSQQELILDTFEDLGWKVNFKKSCLHFSQSAVFVGCQVWRNFNGVPWVRTLPEKARKLRTLIRRILRDGVVCARRLALVTGQCIAMIWAFTPGQLQLWNLYRDLSTQRSWEDFISVSEALRADLHWWLSALTGWNGAPLCQKAVDIQLATDASNTGWGGCITNTNIECAGAWDLPTRALHINSKELLAVYLTLRSLVRHMRKKNVQVLTDNVTMCAYIYRMGGQDMFQTMVTKAIFLLCQEQGIHLTAKYFKGVLNTQADQLSRQCSTYEWILTPHVFQYLNKLWGPFTCDRFTSSLTTKVWGCFNSYFWNPGTTGVDALAQPWAGQNNFINPTFFLPDKILKKLAQERAEAVMIAPFWRGRHWLRMLRKMSVDRPIVIPQDAVYPVHPNVTPEPLKNPKWQLVAWKVHGSLIWGAGDDQPLQPKCLWHNGPLPRNEHTTVCWTVLSILCHQRDSVFYQCRKGWLWNFCTPCHLLYRGPSPLWQLRWLLWLIFTMRWGWKSRSMIRCTALQGLWSRQTLFSLFATHLCLTFLHSGNCSWTGTELTWIWCTSAWKQ